jgi:glutaredoxin
MTPEAHRIEVLSLEGCPHAEETTRLVRDVASHLLLRAEVFSRTVSEAEMREAGGAGSPTIFVDGRDIEGAGVSSGGES